MPSYGTYLSQTFTQASNSGPVLHLPDVPTNLHAKNRTRLLERIRKISGNSTILLQGGNYVHHYNADTTYQFRQESFFIWMFGVREPGFYGLLDIKTGDSVLFLPRYPPEFDIWMGPIGEPQDVTDYYAVTASYYVDEIDDVIFRYQPDKVLLLSGINSDSGLLLPPAEFINIYDLTTDTELLYPIMSELRVIKTPDEIDIIIKACSISCAVHKHLMNNIQECQYEYQAESLFLHSCYFSGGCRTTAYTNNCSSGRNSSILHYGDVISPNYKMILDGEMCLFDMGVCYLGYASDITVSFPYSGKFDPMQKIIYNAVLDARDAVINAIKPGVSWVDMHIRANKTMLKRLTQANILIGNVDEMIEAGVSGILQPHGVGHLLGIDVHDVGGYLDNTPPRPVEPWMKYLRTARILEEGIVITVEPGCYFIDQLINQALNDDKLCNFFNKNEIEKLRGFGGVRIEDDVLVTRHGCKVLTPLPRTVDEIEAWMQTVDIKNKK